MSRTAKLVNSLLNRAIQQKATDVHFIPNTNKTNVYFRIEGQRMHYKHFPNELYRSFLAHLKFLSGMDIGDNRKPQSSSIYNYKKNYDLRLSTLPLSEIESLAIRILPHQLKYSLKQSFLFPFQLKQVLETIQKSSGLFLVSGPTGSGKSTMLYHLINFLVNKHNYQAITIEDPIEQNINNVIQVQLNKQANVTFSSSLIAALRHDPDLIMIGEIRDDKTAEIAFEAALTGHLVFSTVHAKNTIGTIQRLLDMGLSKTDLLQTLIGIASTALVNISTAELKRRALLLELLINDELEWAIKDKGAKKPKIQTFKDLMNKAHAYGFLSNENVQKF